VARKTAKFLVNFLAFTNQNPKKLLPFAQIFNFMSKEKTVQKATKKEPAKSLKEKQADKKAKKEGKKFLQ
jgi:hypothetical protein